MPDAKGRFTGMEREFIKHMARTNDATYAAAKAGYKHPVTLGSRLAAHPLIKDATFAEVRRFLKNEGAAIGVYTLAELAIDTSVPAGIRRAASSDLAKLSGVAVDEASAAKEDHEKSLEELRRDADKLERQREAMLKLISDQTTRVIDVDPAETGEKSDVFG